MLTTFMLLEEVFSNWPTKIQINISSQFCYLFIETRVKGSNNRKRLCVFPAPDLKINANEITDLHVSSQSDEALASAQIRICRCKLFD